MEWLNFHSMYVFLHLFREAVLQALSHCAEVKYHLENLILGNMYLLNAKLNQIKEQMIFLKF